MDASTTRCWRAGKLLDSDFSLEQVSEHLRARTATVWVDLVSPENDELEILTRELGLHRLALEDATSEHERPKLDRYPDHAFLAAYAVDEVDGNLTPHRVSAFITPRALITVHDEGFDPQVLVDRWDENADLAKAGVGFLLHGLIDAVVDSHFDAVQSLDERVEALEDDLFDPKADQNTLQRKTFELRRSLVLLRRVVLPMREVVNTLLRRDLDLVDDTMGPYFQDVYDHVLRATEWTESLRDLVTSVLETNLTIQSNKLNIITKQVTSWAAIIAVPTAITGFYGQNLPYPGFADTAGFVTSSGLIVAGSVALFAVFKKKGWL